MTTLCTKKEMTEDGWKQVQVAGHKLMKIEDGCTLYCQWNKHRETMDPTVLLDVIEKLGRPYKIHSADRGVLTLEY